MRKTMVGLAMAMAMAMAMAGGLAAAPAAAATGQTEVVGTWRVTVTPDAGGPPPSSAYHTYNQDGSLLQSNLTEGAIPGQGVWTRTGDHQFTFTFEKFVPFNPILQTAGTFVFKIRETIVVRGNRYAGRAEALFCDASGEDCISAGAATTTARRMRVERPNLQ